MRLTLKNLDPEQCISIMENMHGKKFLGKKVFVTSVVANSPIKSTVSLPQDSNIPSVTNSDSVIMPNQNMTTGIPADQSAVAQVDIEVCAEDCSGNSILSDLTRASKSPILDPNLSRNICQTKQVLDESLNSDNLDEFSFSPPVSGHGLISKVQNLEDMFELPNKRKASTSPEQKDLSKKGRSTAKKERKNKMRLEQKSKLRVDVSPKN